MMRPLLTLGLLLVGCVGEAEFQLQTQGTPSKPSGTSGTPGIEHPVQVGQFQGMSDGLPAARLSGTAQFDGALYAVSMDGLYRLTSGASRWEAVPLSGPASSVRRIDTTL